MAETKKEEKLEREYVIPLRDKWRRVPRYKRANKAIKAIKEFLAKHMRVENRDLKKVKIDSYLNEEIWFRGIKKPPARIKIKAIKKENGEVKAELFEFKEKLKFKKAREEKRDATATKTLEEKKKAAQPLKEKVKEELGKKEEDKTSEETKGLDTSSTGRGVEEPAKGEEKKVEEKEKKSAVVEAGEKRGKAAAKQVKHETKGDMKQPKRQPRKALAK
jgi:large subunit ribosomal protein L31e